MEHTNATHDPREQFAFKGSGPKRRTVSLCARARPSLQRKASERSTHRASGTIHRTMSSSTTTRGRGRRRWRRLNWLLRWGGLAVCAVVAGVWGMSERWQFEVDRQLTYLNTSQEKRLGGASAACSRRTASLVWLDGAWDRRMQARAHIGTPEASGGLGAQGRSPTPSSSSDSGGFVLTATTLPGFALGRSASPSGVPSSSPPRHRAWRARRSPPPPPRARQQVQQVRLRPRGA